MIHETHCHKISNSFWRFAIPHTLWQTNLSVGHRCNLFLKNYSMIIVHKPLIYCLWSLIGSGRKIRGESAEMLLTKYSVVSLIVASVLTFFGPDRKIVRNPVENLRYIR